MGVPAGYQYQIEVTKNFIAHGHELGIREGLCESKIECLLEGKRELVLKLLKLKLRKLSKSALDRIQHAALPELKQWTERI